MAYEDDRAWSLHMPFLLLFFCICWHYWHKWNRQSHILPLHSWASAVYGYKSFSLIPSLKALNKRCSMNGWKDASGNPVYTGVKCCTGYESHPFDRWAFQEAWSYGAWASLSLRPSFFFSCSRIPPHSCICYADALCQVHGNACRYACGAIRCFPKEASCP